MENFKNIKKKNSFLGEYTKVYKDELQAIGAMGIFIGITFLIIIGPYRTFLKRTLLLSLFL